MKCLYCHEVIDPLGKFCPKCGLPLSEEITLQGAPLPGRSPAVLWLSGSKPLIALVAASAIGAFIGVSAGWLGARMGSQADSQGQVGISRAAPIEPSGPPPAGTGREERIASAASASASIATSAAPEGSGGSASAVAAAPDAAAPAPDGDEPAAEKEPVAHERTAMASLFSTHEFDGIWATDRPKKRYHRPSYVPPPDPLPPPTPLAMNPFRERSPQYVLMYWLGPTADLYGNEGPGPAEKTAQGSQYFLEQY